MHCLSPLLHMCALFAHLSNCPPCIGVCSGLKVQARACKFCTKSDWISSNMCDRLGANMCIHVFVYTCECCMGVSGIWIISLWVIFREVSQAWGREEKGAIVVVQMSVRGAQNRFTHRGLIETTIWPLRLYDHARTSFTLKGLNVSIHMVLHLCAA